MLRWLTLALLCFSLFATGVARANNGSHGPGGAVGVERCASCHRFAYEVWRSGPHAQATESLSAVERMEPKCLTCHASSTVVDVKVGGGIDCERCHGAGGYYHRDYVMRDRELAEAVGLILPRAAECRQCHSDDAPSVLPFDFEQMWSRINHGEDARRRWEAQGGKRVPATPVAGR